MRGALERVTMDYKLIRDMGVKPIMPYLSLLSSDILVMALYQFNNVGDSDRALIREELDIRSAWTSAQRKTFTPHLT